MNYNIYLERLIQAKYAIESPMQFDILLLLER